MYCYCDIWKIRVAIWLADGEIATLGSRRAILELN